MKKIYIVPQCEEIELKYLGMLCVSGGFGGDADSPGKSRMFDDWDDNEEW
jgi:hypothetical protein